MSDSSEKTQLAKKPSVLGASMFNFIANIVSGNTSAPEAETTTENANEENKPENINQKETTVLASHLHSELIIDSGGSDREDFLRTESVSDQTETVTQESSFEFKHLSSVTKEYKNGNFLKGCKWQVLVSFKSSLTSLVVFLI